MISLQLYWAKACQVPWTDQYIYQHWEAQYHFHLSNGNGPVVSDVKIKLLCIAIKLIKNWPWGGGYLIYVLVFMLT